MKNMCTGAVWLLVAATTASAQSMVGVSTPPPRSEIPALPEPTPIRSWPAERQDGATLEASVVVHPSAFVPRGAIGLPPGEARREWFEREAPHGGFPLAEPLPGAPRVSRAPLRDDLAAKTPALPLFFGFESIGPNGHKPPDPDLACGYEHQVTVTNDDFAVYDRCGNELFQSDIHDFLGVSPVYALFSPRVVFDAWYDRWVMLWHKKHNGAEESALVFVVSADHTPPGLGSCYVYTIDALQSSGGNAAYAADFDLGYGRDHLSVGGNMYFFSGGVAWARIWVLDKSQVYAGLPTTARRWSNLLNADGTYTRLPRAVEMQVSWKEGAERIDATWINSRPEGGSKLTLWKLRDASGTGTPLRVDIPVAGYALPPSAVQPTGELLDTLDCRLMPAVITGDELGSNGTELFTSLNAEREGRCGIMLFKLDPRYHTLEFQANFGGSGYDYWFASPVADFSGSAAWVFARTADIAGEEPEIRFIDMRHGTFSSVSSQVRDGDGSYFNFRWGEYFGGQLDWGDYLANLHEPGRPSKMWVYGEYGRDDSWGTYVGTTSMFLSGRISAVSPTTTYEITGPVGGPFTPSARVYGVTVMGDVGLGLEITSLPSWLDATPEAGPAYPGLTLVELSVNAVADSLPAGVYQDTVGFKNCYFWGKTLQRAVRLVVISPGTPYCYCNAGNPSGNVPPCGNYNNGVPPLGGCRHDDSSQGARLDASGLPSLSDPTLLLRGTRGPDANSTLFFQANNELDGPPHNYIGDGIQCAGGGLIRLQVRTTVGGTAKTSVDIPARSASFGHPISPGETLYYQWWIRDPGGSPCGNESNTSNGVAVLWMP